MGCDDFGYYDNFGLPDRSSSSFKTQLRKMEWVVLTKKEEIL